jgi:hypothetical protein
MLVALLLTGACAGSGERSEQGDDAMSGHHLSPTMEVKVAPESVRFVLHVTNSGDSPITLEFSSSQRYDFVVKTLEGETVWRWSDDMAFMQALSQATLAPGESWTMDAVWEPDTPSGEYRAVGMLTAREHPLQQETAFRLP